MKKGKAPQRAMFDVAPIPEVPVVVIPPEPAPPEKKPTEGAPRLKPGEIWAPDPLPDCPKCGRSDCLRIRDARERELALGYVPPPTITVWRCLSCRHDWSTHL